MKRIENESARRIGKVARRENMLRSGGGRKVGNPSEARRENNNLLSVID